MTAIRNRLRVLLIVATSLLLTACARVDNFSDLQSFMDDVKSRPGSEVEAVPVFQPYEGFIYGAASFRGPFDAPVVIDTESGIAPAQNVQPNFDRPKDELESHSLSELVMVGMLTTDGVYTGLIEDAFAEVHKVYIGNHIGRNFGRISSISETQMHIVEIVPSGNGGWIERPQTLTLQ